MKATDQWAPSLPVAASIPASTHHTPAQVPTVLLSPDNLLLLLPFTCTGQEVRGITAIVPRRRLLEETCLRSLHMGSGYGWDPHSGAPGQDRTPPCGTHQPPPPVRRMWLSAPTTTDPSESAIHQHTFHHGLGPRWAPGVGNSPGQDPASTQAL